MLLMCFELLRENYIKHLAPNDINCKDLDMEVLCCGFFFSPSHQTILNIYVNFFGLSAYTLNGTDKIFQMTSHKSLAY